MPTASVSEETLSVQVDLQNEEGSWDVYELAQTLQQVQKTLLGELLKTMQQAALKEALGPRYGSNNRFDEKCCPQCGSHEANRKGFRTRKLSVPGVGMVEVPKAYVSCRECGRSWGPYDEALGLPENKTYAPQALLEPLKEAIRTTYRKASEWAEWAPSPMTLWRNLTKHPPETKAPDGETVCVDATKVPSQGQGSQWSLSVAHEFPSGPASRTVVASTSGKEQAMKSKLANEELDTLIHDGKLDFSEVASRPARCWWHLPRQLRVLMHQEGIHDPNNRWLQRSFTRCLYALPFDEEQARRYCSKWAEVIKPLSERASRYVRGAQEGIVQYLKDPGAFATNTTSWVEREMAEINKRFENGAVWSQHGSGAMLAHHQMLRHHPDTWVQRMKQKLGNSVP